ncbi:hypothetical protein JB92DRAFT_2834586 [Gautieria morchelliformis]|nr:hypothetical protein JB92DRAFT_2834586 [Gautieria morchelliformis]
MLLPIVAYSYFAGHNNPVPIRPYLPEEKDRTHPHPMGYIGVLLLDGQIVRWMSHPTNNHLSKVSPSQHSAVLCSDAKRKEDGGLRRQLDGAGGSWTRKRGPIKKIEVASRGGNGEEGNGGRDAGGRWRQGGNGDLLYKKFQSQRQATARSKERPPVAEQGNGTTGGLSLARKRQ